MGLGTTPIYPGVMIAQPSSLRIWSALDTIGQMVDIQPEQAPNGAIALVVSAHALYEWRRDSTTVADGVVVVANAKGAGTPGRWHKLTNILVTPSGTVLTFGAIVDGSVLYRDGTEILGAPGSVAGEPLVYNPALPGWERVGASSAGLDNQGKPISNFHNFIGDATAVAAGGGAVALNLSAAVASLPTTAFGVRSARLVGFAVTWWDNVDPSTEVWTDDLVVTVYRSALNAIVLSDDAGGTASGAGAASLVLTGGSGATYSVSVDTGTGLMTLSMDQDGVDARRALVTTYYRDAVQVTAV